MCGAAVKDYWSINLLKYNMLPYYLNYQILFIQKEIPISKNLIISNVHVFVTPSAVRFVSYDLAYTFTCWDSTLPHLSHHKREINSLAALLLWKYAVDAVDQLSIWAYSKDCNVHYVLRAVRHSCIWQWSSQTGSSINTVLRHSKVLEFNISVCVVLIQK